MVKTTESSKVSHAKQEPQKDTMTSVPGNLPSLGTQPTGQDALKQQPPPDRTGSTIPKRADLEAQG